MSLTRWFAKHIIDRPRKIAHDIRNRTNDAVETLTGQKVSRVVEEFCEVYGQVLLGMDREVQKQKRINRIAFVVAVAAFLMSLAAFLVRTW